MSGLVEKLNGGAKLEDADKAELKDALTKFKKTFQREVGMITHPCFKYLNPIKGKK